MPMYVEPYGMHVLCAFHLHSFSDTEVASKFKCVILEQPGDLCLGLVFIAILKSQSLEPILTPVREAI